MLYPSSIQRFVRERLCDCEIINISGLIVTQFGIIVRRGQDFGILSLSEAELKELDPSLKALDPSLEELDPSLKELDPQLKALDPSLKELDP